MNATQILVFIAGGLMTIAIGVVGWFVSRLFSEIERSRENERKLFELCAQNMITYWKDQCELARRQK